MMAPRVSFPMSPIGEPVNPGAVKEIFARFAVSATAPVVPALGPNHHAAVLRPPPSRPRSKRTGATPKPQDCKAAHPADSNGDEQISREEFERYAESIWATKTPGLTVPPRLSRAARSCAAMAWAPKEIVCPDAVPTILRKRRRAPSSRGGAGKHWQAFLHGRADKRRDELSEKQARGELYHVERIVASRHDGTQLLVKWLGYSEDESTWELRSSFSEPDELRKIAEYEASLPRPAAATQRTQSQHRDLSADLSLAANRSEGAAAAFGASPRAMEMASLLMEPQHHRPEPLAGPGEEQCRFDAFSPNTSLAADLLSRSLHHSGAPQGILRGAGAEGQGDSLENEPVSLSQSSASTEEMEAEAVHARPTTEGALDLAMPCPLCRRDIKHAAADLDGIVACFPCMRAHVMYQGE